MRRSSRRRFRRGTTGASAVEFALVAVPLILLLVATIEFGRLLWTRQAMQSLAVSAARCMGVPQTACSTSGVYNAGKTTDFIIHGATVLGVDLLPANIVLNGDASCESVADFSTVTISHTFKSVASSLIPGLTNGVSLTTSACFPNQS
jgi:Flp pilus assembly pilin Flp